MTSNKFFKEKAKKMFKNKKIDIAFIDGLHHYKQVLKDILNCLNYLSDKGVIIIHDCNPTSQKMQIVPRIQEEWTGDVWKSIVNLRSFRKDLNIFVINSDYGTGIIRKGEPENMLNYSKKKIERMSYKYFNMNRKLLLNLKNIKFLNKFLSHC